ncbi:UrcA family protein, partial [Raoultella ornithinolytica]|uniref:UrcA family protein n=1 Tax=Raoultella ornithinolytica TaxID=54291 RepID=UPI0013DC676E
AALAVPAVPAFAQNRVKVSYRSGELATATGRAALHRRVNHAAARACGDDRVPGSILPSRAVRACHKIAVEAARPQVDRAIALANR